MLGIQVSWFVALPIPFGRGNGQRTGRIPNYSTTLARWSCLHAETDLPSRRKCIVVDNRSVFVSSANFTEAAQQRNLEVGLLIHSESLAEKLTRHFDTLLAECLLQPMG